MGKGASSAYRGLGPSLLDENLNGAISSFGVEFGKVTPRMREAFDISTLIWKGDYFKGATP